MNNARIKIKKGLAIPLEGDAPELLKGRQSSDLLKIYPDDFHGIIPKLKVREGDALKVGTPIFYEKNFPDMVFVSPVSGVLKRVVRGAKRRILFFEIENDHKNEQIDVEVPEIDSMIRPEVQAVLLRYGFWPFIKQRPYDVIANPDLLPRDIFITGFSSAPLAPNYEFILEGKTQELNIGLKVLRKLTEGNLYLSVPSNCELSIDNDTDIRITEFDGPHPSGNVGVQINHLKPVNKGEQVWTLNLIDVAIIGEFFKNKRIDFTRKVVLCGSEVPNESRGFYEMTIGTDLSEILPSQKNKKLRYICGDPLTGINMEDDHYLHFYDSQITVIPEGDNTHELFGWASLSARRYSAGDTYLSKIISKMRPSKKYALDARILGGERAIIMSDEYDKVFPMNIYPEFLLKSIIAFNIDKMENLGIYEVAPEDFALCEFVDTSKLEIQKIVRHGLDLLRKEME